VLSQDGHQLRRNGDDADRAARPVLQPALFVPGPVVGPLLADAWRGLVQVEAASAGFGQVAVIGAERDRFRRAQHREVQAGEEGDKSAAATYADVADSGKELAYLLG